MIELLNADARHIPLADNSVQCVITSPPYYGLRDYGTATWKGGSVECDHRQPETRKNGSTLTGGKSTTGHAEEGYKTKCAKCGAIRVDRQIGLERTPQEYVDGLVGVFREVKRVLRDDGTLWLNLGASYSPLTMFSQYYKMREHLSFKEICYVALEMFGVRFNEYKETLEGPVSEVLSVAVQSKADKVRPRVAGQDIARELSTPPGTKNRKGKRKAQESKMDADSEYGREVFLLRGSNNGVLDDRSYQQRRSGASQISNGAEPREFTEDLSGHLESGVSEGQIPSSVLQLQFFNRVLGILSTHSFTYNEIPDSVRFAFAQEIEWKHKDEIDIPGLVCEALRRDGWYRRATIIWSKPNPMPESVTDRPTKAHEYVFLLSKSEKYFYDHEAIKEKGYGQPAQDQKKLYSQDGQVDRLNKAKAKQRKEIEENGFVMRNKRTVWTVATSPYSGAHFATFPPKLVEPMVLAGSRPGDIVLDPFSGTGTVGRVAIQHRRRFVGLELNPGYIELAQDRTSNVEVRML